MTVRLLPENLTRAPFELGCRPSAASSTPALTSSSLYLVISVSSFSSGRTPASDSLLALTRTMNRMIASPSTTTSNEDERNRQLSASFLKEFPFPRGRRRCCARRRGRRVTSRRRRRFPQGLFGLVERLLRRLVRLLGL